METFLNYLAGAIMGIFIGALLFLLGFGLYMSGVIGTSIIVGIILTFTILIWAANRLDRM